jgi:hypothetical protein
MWHRYAVRNLALMPATFKQFSNERKQDSTVSIVDRPWVGQSRVRIMAEEIHPD